VNVDEQLRTAAEEYESAEVRLRAAVLDAKAAGWTEPRIAQVIHLGRADIDRILRGNPIRR
jgi:hypothetical protein